MGAGEPFYPEGHGYPLVSAACDFEFVSSLIPCSPSKHFDGSGRQIPGCHHVTIARYVFVPGDRTFAFATEATPEWETIYLAYTSEHIVIKNMASQASPRKTLPTVTSPAIARRYKLFVPPWVISRLKEHGFELVSHADPMPKTELREGDTFIVAFADSNWRESFAIYMRASRYTKVPSATRVYCVLRFGTEFRPPQLGDDGLIEPGFDTGDFIDTWGGMSRGAGSFD